MKKTLKRIALWLIGGFGLYVLSIVVWEWWEGTFYYDFNLDDRFDIELTADECGTCFLDWPIDFEIEIYDLVDDQDYKFYFFTGEGPYLRFYISTDYPDLILIEGYENNGGLSWVIDLKEESINQGSLHFRDSRESFVEMYELTGKFDLIKK